MQAEVTNNQPIEEKKTVRAAIIANPNAGSYEQHRPELENTQRYLQEQGWQVAIKLTEQAGDGKRLAREAVEQKFDIVIATGGDGTINEVIQGLANTDTALGVLPSGTVNVWAREVGIPINDFAAAREVLLNGQTRRIDLGRVNNKRYFLLMSTIGFDAEVTRSVETKKKKLGVLSYIAHGAWLGLGYPNFTVYLQIGQRAIRAHALQIIFGNTQLYAGTIKFTWQAKCDDGLLDISLVRSQNVLGRFSVLVDFLLRKKSRTQWIRYDSAKEIKIHTNRKIALQVDGDPEGETNPRNFPATTISVAPGALKVIIPRELPDPSLFTQ